MSLLFEPGGHVYTLDGVVLPSVTGVLKASGLVNFDQIPPSILDAAKARGTAVHQAIHYYNEHDLDVLAFTRAFPGYAPYLECWIRLMETGRLQTVLCEHRVASRTRGVCGTIDWLGLFDGKGAILDFATGSPEDSAKDLQTAAYEDLGREWAREPGEDALRAFFAAHPFIRRYSVQLNKSGKLPKPQLYASPRDKTEFFTLLAGQQNRPRPQTRSRRLVRVGRVNQRNRSVGMSLAADTVMDTPQTEVRPAEVLVAAEKAKADALVFLENNKVLVIDQASCQQAVIIRQQIPIKLASVREGLAKPKSWAFNLHRWFCALESAATAPYDQLDQFERAQIQAWNDEQAAHARAKERELAEQRRKEEQDRAVAAAAALEEEARSAPSRVEADEMFAQADAIVAEAIAAPAPVVVVESAAAAVVGLNTRRVWGWRFIGGPKPTKGKDLLKTTPPAIIEKAKAKMPRELLMVDEKKIDGIVKAMTSSTAIPGIETFFDDIPIR